MLVFNVKHKAAGGCVIPVPGATSFRWAPDSPHAVLVLKRGGIACVTVHPYPHGSPTELVRWVTPFPASLPCKPRLVLAPGLADRTLWVLHATAVTNGGTCVSLVALRAADLSVRGGQQLEVADVSGHPVSVDASRQAVALGFRCSTCVYRLAEPHAAALLLFRADALSQAQFSPDGVFIVGLHCDAAERRVLVLNARCGTCVASLASADSYTPADSSISPAIQSAAWSTGNQLVVRIVLKTGEGAAEDEEELQDAERGILGLVLSELQL